MANTPPRSRRAKILQNLQRQLRTIQVANGYTQDVVEVSQNVKNWADKGAPETPIIYVVDEATVPQYHAGKLMEWDWNIALICVMRDKQQEDMEEMISDILDCLLANTTLAFPETGRTISHIRVTNIVTDSQLYSEIENSMLFRVDVVLKYTQCVDQNR